MQARTRTAGRIDRKVLQRRNKMGGSSFWMSRPPCRRLPGGSMIAYVISSDNDPA